MSTVLQLVLLSVGGSTVLGVFGGLLVRRIPHRFNDAVLATAGGAISRQRERSMSSIRTSRSFGLTKWETRFPWVRRLKEGPNEIRHHRWCGGGDAGHGFDPATRKVTSKLVVDDANPSHHSYLLELVDNPQGVKGIYPA